MSVIDDDEFRPLPTGLRALLSLGPAMDTPARLLSPVEALAERADDLGRRALRLRALSRTRPHVFLEDKEELAKAVFQLAEDLRRFGRLPQRTASFRAGAVVSGQRAIPVETRRRVPKTIRGGN